MAKELKSTFDLGEFLESFSKQFEGFGDEAFVEKFKELAKHLKDFEPVLISELKHRVEEKKREKTSQWILYASGGALALAIVLALMCKK